MSIQLAVIEDPEEYLNHLSADQLDATQRSAVPFHVIINPKLTLLDGAKASFFEGCLSVDGFSALVPRALECRVDCLGHDGEPRTFTAEGWHARIVQHEVDHLHGGLYIDRMRPRSFITVANLTRYWNNLPIDELLEAFGP